MEIKDMRYERGYKAKVSLILNLFFVIVVVFCFGSDGT